MAFFFCIGRRKSKTSYRQDLRHRCTVYTNSLLVALNARKMIRNAFEQNRLWDGAKLSLSQFFKNSSTADGVEFIHFDISDFFGSYSDFYSEQLTFLSK